MTIYIPLDVTQVNQLTVNRKGIFCPSFELTDGAYTYGKLSFKGILKRQGFIETAGANWMIKQKSMLRGDVSLTDENGNEIAATKTKMWSGKVSLELPDGTSLQYKRDGMFSKKLSWYSESYGKLLTIESKWFSYKTPFIISFEPIISKTNIDPLMLTFMAINVTLVRQEQAAAAAH